MFSIPDGRQEGDSLGFHAKGEFFLAPETLTSVCCTNLGSLCPGEIFVILRPWAKIQDRSPESTCPIGIRQGVALTLCQVGWSLCKPVTQALDGAGANGGRSLLFFFSHCPLWDRSVGPWIPPSAEPRAAASAARWKRLIRLMSEHRQQALPPFYGL